MLARSALAAARVSRAATATVLRGPCAVQRRCVGIRPPVVKHSAAPTPRTTTHPKHVKMKKLTKYAGGVMQQLDLEFRQKVDRSKDDPFEVGDAVMVKAYDYKSQKRPAVYKGVVISIKNKGLGTTFRILNTYDGEKFEVRVNLCLGVVCLCCTYSVSITSVVVCCFS